MSRHIIVRRGQDGRTTAGRVVARWRYLAAVILAIAGLAAPSLHAEEKGPAERATANRQFVAAIKLIEQADRTYDQTEEARLLREANRLLTGIVDAFPESDLAVQLATNQFIGDFDYFEFKSRVDSLICREPLSSACFIYRLTTLLPPIETPITTARWDWLSLAIAHHHILKDPGRARTIVAPFVSAVRRGNLGPDAEPDLFVGRALALTGEVDEALRITRAIDQCPSRLYNLVDVARAENRRGDAAAASSLLDEARSFADGHGCHWEAGVILQGLIDVGRAAEARELFAREIDADRTRVRNKTDGFPPELAVAAADLATPDLALSLLRSVADEYPWTVPAALARLASRGERTLVASYAEHILDLDLRAEALAEIIAALLAADHRPDAEAMMERLTKLAAESGSRRPILLAQRAKAERLMFTDDRWRTSFNQALTAAERSSTAVRRDIGAPLLSALVRMETGLALLD